MPISSVQFMAHLKKKFIYSILGCRNFKITTHYYKQPLSICMVFYLYLLRVYCYCSHHFLFDSHSTEWATCWKSAFLHGSLLTSKSHFTKGVREGQESVDDPGSPSKLWQELSNHNPTKVGNVTTQVKGKKALSSLADSDEILSCKLGWKRL